MKRLLFYLMLIMISGHTTYGQDLYWNTDGSEFNSNMSVTAVISFNEVEQKSNYYEIAAFDNKNRLRGNGKAKYNQNQDRYFFYLTIYGNSSEKLTFKIYDHSIEEELSYTTPDYINFIADGFSGSITKPYIINFNVITFEGNGSWSDASNWLYSNMPKENDDIIIDGTASVSKDDNITIKSFKINENKSLAIEDGGILNVKGSISTQSPDALIINDGGQILQSNKNVSATFKKNIINPESWSNPNSGWQFISSPMINAATADFESATGDYDLYKFDGTQELQWVNYKYHNDFDETFLPGTGYIASYETQNTAYFRGTLNGETSYFDFNVSYNPDIYWANFHLLGNPFTFDIDWNDISSMGIKNGFVTINSKDGTYRYNMEGIIKVGEGFMVCTEREDPQMQYKKLSKSRDNDYNYINIIASNSKGSDNLIINFNEEVCKGFPKLDNINKDVSVIYARDNDTRYGIFNCKEDEECPIYFDVQEMGNYTLKFNIIGELDNIYLLDKKTGERVNIIIENEYSFIANSTDANDRFILYKEAYHDLGSFAYVNNGNLIVNGLSGNTQINIYDALGRNMKLLSHDDHRINIESLPQGIYIIRLIDDNGIKTQKIIF